MLDSPIYFPCGKIMKNRFMLAPLTNEQSNNDGSLSDDEFKWLTKRAEGGFGLVMTCASHVQKIGQGFPGQLGIFSDDLADGHQRLTKKIKSHGSLAVVQLHHAGMRSPKELIGEPPICPSEHQKTGAREMNLDEVVQLKNDFVEAAKRAKKWGYDGVEIHGAHGYILTQFLSSEINQRNDQYGGSLENRARLLFEIIEETRTSCGKDFLVGVRLSPERFGMKMKEVRTICQQLIDHGKIDFLDLSLWDVFKTPEEEEYQTLKLLDYFMALDRKQVQLTVAGKIRTSENVNEIISKGVDFVTIGRAAILHHDFPKKVISNDQFEPIDTPVTRDYLRKEGLGEKFIDYMKKWPDFVEK
jgi:2,4-dienoyl-CoA reductase-like NADH-dependent reductase (Old Yellow Enzyme family)